MTRIGSVPRVGGLGRERYDQPIVAGWGIVDGMGFAVGRNGDRQAGTEYRCAGDQPAQRPWRYRESGADVARGKTASGARSASGCCRASPRSCLAIDQAYATAPGKQPGVWGIVGRLPEQLAGARIQGKN